jgi:hypothetical protein
MSKKLPAFTFRTLINNYGGYIGQTLGMDETAIQKDYEEYKELQPDGSVRDFMWSLFQRMILNGADDNVYRSIGRFVARFESKNGNQYHRLGLKMEFEAKKDEERSSGVVWGFECIADKRCSHSMKYDNIWHDFKEYPDGLPLASEECSLNSCSCTAKKDKNGDIIFTNI